MRERIRRYRNSWSLRNRAHSVAALAIVVSWVCGSFALYVSADREYERMCHQNLSNLAETILTLASHELHEIHEDGGAASGDPVHRETEATLGARYSYQIWSLDGQLLLRSVSAPPTVPLGTLGVAGLSHKTIDGKEQEVFVVVSQAHAMQIHVADSRDGSMVMSDSFLVHLVLGFLVSLVPVLMLSWLLMRRAFESLTDTARQMRGRNPTDTRPLNVSNPPRELQPLVGAINNFMGMSGQELMRQRSFTALAAHELRTPLASMRVQAQVLSRAQDGPDRIEGAAALMHSVDRCARLVTQLLTLARADALTEAGAPRAPIAVGEAFNEVLGDFAEELGRRSIVLHCELHAQEVFAERVGLQTLLRNLVSNAIRHTPDSGAIRVATASTPEAVTLAVEDSGDGIPEPEYENVFRRFYRRPGETGTGVGLGLAIVASVADAHGAVVKLARSSLGGLRVNVSFPTVA